MVDEPEKVQLGSPDLAAENRAALTELFPGVLADGVLDVTRLTELLGVEPAAVADGRERYGLQWAGKKEAIKSLLTPSRGSLVPDLERSIDFDTAQNVFIEGDNLEVLKLMQKAYNDKIKLIYIDPPYNTGNDFVYNDDFSDGLRRYLEYTGQVDAEGNRASANADTAGRRHSRWLSMMYPRLILARNLLTQDGILLCSINDVEFGNLVTLLRSVFGEENFLATFIWNNDGNIEQQSRIKVNHEYVVAFARNHDLVAKPTVIDPNVAEESKLFRPEIENSITKNGPANPPSTVLLPQGFPASAEKFEVEPRVDAFPHILTRIVALEGVLAEPAQVRSGWSSRRLLDLFIANRFVPIEDSEGRESRFAITPTGAIYLYKRRSESQGHVVTVLRNLGTTKASSSWLKRNWGISFDYPKPERLIQHLVAVFTSGQDVVLDFFAGSGTTAHAVALQNATDRGERRSILVNLPEPAAPDSIAAKAGFETVSEIAVRRVMNVVQTVDGASAKGLRTYTLGISNFRTAIDEEDLLYKSTLSDGPVAWSSLLVEVLLAEGVALDQAWERQRMDDAEIVLSGGVAVVLSKAVSDALVAAAFALRPRVAVFLEDGFEGADAVKANAVTNARNLGITMKTV